MSSKPSQDEFSLGSLRDLADICISLGHLDKAEDIMERASVFIDGEYMTGSPLTADHMTIRGTILARRGDDEAAERALARAGQIREELIEAGKLSTAGRARHGKTLVVQAEILDRLRRPDEARRLRVRASEIQEELVTALERSLVSGELQRSAVRAGGGVGRLSTPPIGGTQLMDSTRFTGEEW